MTDDDRLILDLATRHYLHAGSREAAIRTETGLSPTRFWQRANELLDDPAAALEQPMAVARLRRQRDRARAYRRAS